MRRSGIFFPDPTPPDDGGGDVEAAVKGYTDTLHLGADDVRSPMVAAAARLARALDEGVQVPAVARELGKYLRWMSEFGAVADELDALRSGHALRQADAVLRRTADTAS